jgi:hypothetical protein
VSDVTKFKERDRLPEVFIHAVTESVFPGSSSHNFKSSAAGSSKGSLKKTTEVMKSS